MANYGTIFRHCVAELKEEIRAKEDALGRGHARTWEDYSKITGEIKALRFSVELLEETEKKFDEI